MREREESPNRPESYLEVVVVGVDLVAGQVWELRLVDPQRLALEVVVDGAADEQGGGPA